MYAKIYAALLGAFILVSAPLITTASAEKKITPQQQKMKDCGAKWQVHKKAQNVKGRDAYRKFLGTCLKT